MHPEWPTFKKGTGLKYSKYKKINGKYQPYEEGSAGFIDFAIGDYNEPEIGIEFSLKYGWSNEAIVYDFLKLLDKNNPFKLLFLTILYIGKKIGNYKPFERPWKSYGRSFQRSGKEAYTW